MDKCKHVGQLRLAPDHSTLNPQKWHCVDCNTTESVWACLSCAHVACGRYIEEHALRHFQESAHPMAMEVNELYVFCYLCDDYVLNDNATSDLKLLRSMLSAIKSQNYDCMTRSGRTLRSMVAVDDAYACQGAKALLQKEDLTYTALWHRRHALLGKVLRSWYSLTPKGKQRLEDERIREETNQKREAIRIKREMRKRKFKEELKSYIPRKSVRLQYQRQTPPELTLPTLQKRPPKNSPTTMLKQFAPTSEIPCDKKLGDSPIKRKTTVIPGVTGLRNLGNTCYMNSILQILSHLHVFRECFLQLDLSETQELIAAAANGKPRSLSQITSADDFANATVKRTDMGKCLVKRQSSSSGLSGGSSNSRNMELIQPKPSSAHISLCHELHTLFQVMWSGKWALVSPFAMLHSVWRLIPAFRGYAQQDAQEFLCELLDKVQQELEATGSRYSTLIPSSQRKLIKQVLNVVNNIFHGRLLSQVTCLVCDNKSNTVEPFWDLSLEFPERYHCNGKENASQRPCLLTEMLAKFTETEALEGKIYACDQCNTKRRKFSSKPVVLTEAQKQLMVCGLPQVLRLHLKRFRWSGRNHREKIGVHVQFDQILNMKPYCCRESTTNLKMDSFIYDLCAVVMHHGKGFGSGHYTAFCYNLEGGFWVHCNDSKLQTCTVEEVCKAQAYILFYTQRGTQNGHLSNRLLSCGTLSSSPPSTPH